MFREVQWWKTRNTAGVFQQGLRSVYQKRTEISERRNTWSMCFIHGLASVPVFFLNKEKSEI
ncbi:MAG: hypothetical protein OM95_13380 [Bdellovibrio sp. ArHS]|nr:MAG: hypothetical protein OM95_13380 [Bdellovibrio sp. ArHS]